MRKALTCFFLAAFLSAAQIALPASLLVDNNEVCCDLKALLKELGYSSEYDLDSVYAYTKKHWMQFPKNRWEFSNIHEDKRNKLFESFSKLNLIDKIEAKKTHYDLAAIHGATLPRIRNRIAYLIKEWEKGTRFDKVVFLTGPRTLLSSSESKEHLLAASQELPFAKDATLDRELPVNETQMAKFIYESAKLPEGMKKLPVEYVCADIKSAHLFAHITPTTSDTILTFLENQPKEKKILLVSNQPYVMYQDLIAKYFLKDEYEVETIGDKARDKIEVSALLDNIAKCLFWETLSKDASLH
ncbi:MAG: hypothetical protein S4CHLAM37_14650 [Chlamydiia bacterium]|nr:hypothetical protein [Chlamydiia bacterium]